MADETKVLTALGLDTAGFESGMSRATGRVNTFVQALNSVDAEVRKIPLIGDIYAISFGKIVDGFAEIRQQSRDFARIMNLDVAGSIENAANKLDRITELSTQLKTGSFGRSVADFSQTFLSKATMGLFGGDPGEERKEQQRDLDKERQATLEQIVSLHKQEEDSRSVDVSNSQLQTDLSKTQLDYAHRIAQAEQEAYKWGGPDRAKWSNQIVSNYQREYELATQILSAEQRAAYIRQSQRDAQREQIVMEARQAERGSSLEAAKERVRLAGEEVNRVAIGTKDQKDNAQALYESALSNLAVEQRRYDLMLLSNVVARENSRLQNSGNERDIAKANLEFAEQRYDIAQKGTDEEKEAAYTEFIVALNRKKEAERNYELQVKQMDLETTAMALQIAGQTRAANLARIQAQYEVRISEERRKGNVEIVKSLESQKKALELQEAIREYELGYKGRAQERLEERRKRQEVRIAQSQLDQRSRDEKGRSGLTSGGLTSGGLTSGARTSLLDKNSTPTVQIDGAKTFQTELMKTLGGIQKSLSR